MNAERPHHLEEAPDGSLSQREFDVREVLMIRLRRTCKVTECHFEKKQMKTDENK